MENANFNLLVEFDDIRRCQAVLYDGTAEEQFLRFVALQEECRLQWLAAVQEGQRLQRELDDSLKQMSDLESNLHHARRLLDVESKLRKSAEQQRDILEKKLILVANAVQDPSFPRETREKFNFIKEQSNKNKSNYDKHNDNDINSTGSFLSDLSVTHSEDDFLDPNTSKVWKKHRPSLTKQNGIYVGAKHSRLSEELNKSRGKFRKHKNNQSINEKQSNIEVETNEKICATTKVTIPSKGDGPIVAESKIEALPSALIKNKPFTSTPTAETASSASNKIISTETNSCDEENFISPVKKKQMESSFPMQSRTPTAPPLHEINKNANSITPVNKIRRSILRHHNFASKSFIKSVNCCHCNKKIRFGFLGFRCKCCKASVHVDCKEVFNAACVPSSAGTPLKGLMGYLIEYAPSTPPMIPAIIIHCILEIERRGLSEVGIYRISASEREVKALKEKFFRSKVSPHLGQIDIHIICGCVKDFLRFLNEPLVPRDLWSDFTNAIQSKDPEEIQKDLFRAVDRLPQANRDTLAYLILHFHRVARSTETQMSLLNLTRVFGPTIIGYSCQDPDRNQIFAETIIQHKVMENLLNISETYWSKFLEIPDEIGKDTYSKYLAPPPPPPFQTPKNHGIKPPYNTNSLKGSIRMKRIRSPPYSAKK